MKSFIYDYIQIGSFMLESCNDARRAFVNISRIKEVMDKVKVWV